MASFPETTRGFAEYFVTLQELLHEADYDPAMSFTRQEVLKAIEVAETMIEKLMASEDNDKQAFPVLITMNKRSRNEGFERNRPEWIRAKEERQNFKWPKRTFFKVLLRSTRMLSDLLSPLVKGSSSGGHLLFRSRRTSFHG